MKLPPDPRRSWDFQPINLFLSNYLRASRRIDGDGQRAQGVVFSAIDLRGVGNWAGQLLPMATPERTGCNRTDASSGIISERATPGAGCSKQRTVLRPSPRGSLCHAARRRKVSVLRAEHVSDLSRASASERKKRSEAPSLLSSPRAHRQSAQRGVVVGHHQANGAGEVDVFLPLRDPGY